MIESRGLFINGQWEAAEGDVLHSPDPWSEASVWEGRCASVGQIRKSVSAANAAFCEWSRLDFETRSQFLKKFSDSVRKREDQLARIIAVEAGKPLWEAHTEIRAVASKLEPSIAAARQRNCDIAKDSAITRFVPLGAVGVIGPYNFPMHMPNVHIIPALLAGNTVVLKSSELGPASAEAMFECWDEAALPPGVINLIQGDAAAGKQLAEQPEVQGVFFTGSYRVGSALQSQLANSGKMFAVEMGGNSPLIIWDGDDFLSIAIVAIQSCFVTSGQRCSSVRRLIVPDSDYGNRVTEVIINAFSQIHFGHFEDFPEPFYGPVRTISIANDLLKAQKQWQLRGAQSLLTSRPSERSRCLLCPGLLDVTGVATCDEEVMGPLVTLERATSFDAAMAAANRTRFGLAAGLVSENPEIIERFRRDVRAGVLSINLPVTGSSGWAAFGGMGDSGNYRPTGFLSADYCVRAVGAMESQSLKGLQVPPGVAL